MKRVMWTSVCAMSRRQCLIGTATVLLASICVTYLVVFSENDKRALYKSAITEIYKVQSVKRKRIIQRSFVENHNTRFGLLWNILVPELSCPYLVRVGNVNDGGKWLCNPFALKFQQSASCLVYSLG